MNQDQHAQRLLTLGWQEVAPDSLGRRQFDKQRLRAVVGDDGTFLQYDRTLLSVPVRDRSLDYILQAAIREVYVKLANGLHALGEAERTLYQMAQSLDTLRADALQLDSRARQRLHSANSAVADLLAVLHSNTLRLGDKRADTQPGPDNAATPLQPQEPA